MRMFNQEAPKSPQEISDHRRNPVGQDQRGDTIVDLLNEELARLLDQK